MAGTTWKPAATSMWVCGLALRAGKGLREGVRGALYLADGLAVCVGCSEVQG